VRPPTIRERNQRKRDPGATVGGQKFAEVRAGPSTHPGAAVRKLIRPDVLFEICYRIERRPSFEHDDIESAFSKDFRRGPTGCTGTDDANVVNLGGANYLGHCLVFLAFPVVRKNQNLYHRVHRDHRGAQKKARSATFLNIHSWLVWLQMGP
jgi:hypothetical protein